MLDRTDQLADPAAAMFNVPLLELRRRESSKWTRFPLDVLPLHIAEMDVRLAEPIAAALRRALELSDTGYLGDPRALVDAFRGFAQRRWNWTVDGGSVHVCADVAAGIQHVLRRITRPGERVLIMPPVYPPFFAWLRWLGLRDVQVPLRDLATGGRLDLAGIEAALADGVRVVLLCHPHNPTGRVHEPAELRALAELAARFDAVVLSDEIHAPLVYRATEFAPYLSLGDAARATGIAFTSASKAWNLAGLKCALMIAGTGLAKRDLLEGAVIAGHLGVIANTVAFAACDAWLDELLGALAANAALVRAELARRLPAVTLPEPRATYLAWLDFTALGLDREPASLALEAGRVALVPGADFGGPGRAHARLNFACAPDLLREAVARIASALG